VTWWGVAAAANGVVAVAFFAIGAIVLGPVVRQRQLRSNVLATATAVVFLAFAVDRAALTMTVLAPTVGFGTETGRGLRESYGWPLAVWDVLAAVIAVLYLSLRRGYARMLEGGTLFEDTAQRHREALEINDTVVQGLVAAQLAHRLGRRDELEASLEATLASARGLVDGLLRDSPPHLAGGGEFVPSHATSLRRP